MIFTVVRTNTPQLEKPKKGPEGWVRVAANEHSGPARCACRSVWLVPAHSRGRSHDDVNSDVLVCIRTVLHGSLRADVEFALDFRFVIGQELNGIHLLVFRHPHG
jgi:hypothetical protein